MNTMTASRSNSNSQPIIWLPLLILPVLEILWGTKLPAWQFMWVLAFAIYAGLKWLSYAAVMRELKPSLQLSLGYLLLWPGMDAKSFFSCHAKSKPGWSEWIVACFKVLLGVVLIRVASAYTGLAPIFAGWTGMIGIVFVLHFGLFHLLSSAWRAAGVYAPPIMNSPLLAISLSDFWGKRWNLAFRDLSHKFLFQPTRTRLGVAGATMLVFFVSGVVHDLVISWPAGGGYGLPTLYFLIHGMALLFERSEIGKGLGCRSGWMGRLFCVGICLVPAGLLFPMPFIENVVLPMLEAMQTVWSE